MGCLSLLFTHEKKEIYTEWNAQPKPPLPKQMETWDFFTSRWGPLQLECARRHLGILLKMQILTQQV